MTDVSVIIAEGNHMPRVTDAEERRQQILRAAVSVFSTRGYTSATISDIANAAGLAHGTVYLYFRSKAEIIQSLVSWFLDHLIADMGEPSAPGAAEASFAVDLTRMFSRAMEACARNPRMATVCMREAIAEGPDTAAGLRDMDATLVARLSARIAQAIGSGELRPMEPDYGAHIVARMLGIALQHLLLLGADADVDALAREMVEFIMYGLAADQPRNNPPPAHVV